MSKELTPQQSRFVDEYLVDLNATQAAIRAGEFQSERPASGFYVYLLTNPDTSEVFYVGKGTKNRAKQHARNARAGIVDNAKKYSTICDIHRSGGDVGILYHPAESERRAYQVERQLIAKLRRTGITNYARGTTAPEEKAAAKAKQHLVSFKSKDQWAKGLTPELKAVIVQVFGSLNDCYESVLNGLDRLSKVAD